MDRRYCTHSIGLSVSGFVVRRVFAAKLLLRAQEGQAVCVRPSKPVVAGGERGITVTKSPITGFGRKIPASGSPVIGASNELIENRFCKLGEI